MVANLFGELAHMTFVLKSGDGVTCLGIPPTGHESLIVRRELVLGSPLVSRGHAALRAAPDGHGALLKDLGSSNGTFVNDVRVSAAIIRLGDRVVFGYGGGILSQFPVGCRPKRIPVPAGLCFFLEAVSGPTAADDSSISCPFVLLSGAGQVCRINRPRVTMGRGERADFICTGSDAFMQTSRVNAVSVGWLWLSMVVG